MSVIIHLQAETEKLLKEKAAKAGQTLEAYLKQLAEREAAATNHTEPSSAPLSAEQWSVQWRAWANQDRQLPASIVIDDSRESIYADRSE